MSVYQEIFEKSIDWAMPFQRTSKFPLDRSSLFKSYADALAYARQDKTDSRQLGGTSYVGQIVVVYGPSKSNSNEVAAYLITGVGSDATLMKLMHAPATGDYSADINTLQTQLDELSTLINDLSIEVKSFVDTDTRYEISSGITSGTIQVLTYHNDGTTSQDEVSISGWNDLVDVVNGKSIAYVYQNKLDLNYLADIVTKDKYRVGDLIYFIDLDVPDEWVSKRLDAPSNEIQYEFQILETKHPDLSNYLTKNQSDNLYATKEALSLKADSYQIQNLSDRIDINTQSISSKANQQDLLNIEAKLNELNVAGQIMAAIQQLNTSQIGGEGYYLQSITQKNGVIEAVVQALPNMQEIASSAATGAVETSTTYTNQRIGEIGQITVKEYTDAAVNEQKQELAATNLRITNQASEISTAVNKVSLLEESVATYSGRISALETHSGETVTRLAAIEKRLEEVGANGEANVIEVIKVGGTRLSVNPTDRSIDITAIPTNLLTDGNKPLILDCNQLKNYDLE